MGAGNVYTDYAKLRRHGYGPWAAGVEMGISQERQRALEARFKGRDKPKGCKPAKPAVRAKGIKASTAPIAPTSDHDFWRNDEAHVEAVNRLGGYPRAVRKTRLGKVVTDWIDQRGKRWRLAA